MLALHYGGPKEARYVSSRPFPSLCFLHSLDNTHVRRIRFVPKVKHMGEPMSFKIVLTWIFGLFGMGVEGLKFPGS